MGGVNSGRRPSGQTTRLTLEEKIERNRVRARERWHRLKEQKENGTELKGQPLYKLHYREKYHLDEERLGHLRQPGKTFRVDEDPNQLIKEIKESNRKRLDDILNDPKAIERIFSDRDDVPDLIKAKMKQKNYFSEKEIREMERKLNEEFNLVEDRRGNYQSSYKPLNEETTE
jgi:hypothetical protein